MGLGFRMGEGRRNLHNELVYEEKVDLVKEPVSMCRDELIIVTLKICSILIIRFHPIV
jgi:hypothetical protein